MFDVTQLRQTEFPQTQHQLYFNYASISLLPQCAQARMVHSIERLTDEPMAHWRLEIMPLMEKMNGDIARLINAAAPREINTITSTSYGVNAIAQALPWQVGDNVVLCNIEFPANVYPWLNLAERGVETCLIPADNGGLTVEALAQAVDAHTRVVAVSGVQFFTGHRSDLMALGQFCHEHGLLFVVDMIQAIGHVPVDVQAMHIDALVTGGQKSLLAPPGTGFMYVREEVCARMRPHYLGGNSTVDYLHWLNYDPTPLPGTARFNMGTTNVIGLAGMAASLDLLQTLGVSTIDGYTSGLAAAAMTHLDGLGYEVITPRTAHAGIVTFVSGRDEPGTDALVTTLKEDHHITVVKHLNAEGKAHIRLSFHAYNTLAEIDYLATILQQLR
ncbi:MAG: aminotransferase class V-fold PLP-dependent enzyme [Candidatus Promineifilaceae bacterium]